VLRVLKVTLVHAIAGASAALVGCRSASTPAIADAETHAAAAAVPVRRAVGTDPGHVGAGTPLVPRAGHELAAFAAGCFWGVEDTFRQVPGVIATAVGFTGGHTDAPSYDDVCTHTTGHAETVLLEFDPKVVTYDTLLHVFFANHDPTTRNRQGPDVGDQYRSEVFTFSPAQATAARAAKDKAGLEHQKPVVTAIEPIGRFWKAEEYHQQYDEKTGTHSCPIPKGLAGG
jgi:peptide-methionine (S)-S-oxide reductase